MILNLLLSYSINKFELIIFIFAFFFSILRKPKDKSIAISAGCMSVGLALGDLVHGSVISTLENSTQVYYWYLVWALFSLSQAFLVLLCHWCLAIRLTDQVKVVFVTMAGNAILNTAMFIDRNIIALNFDDLPNSSRSESWLLWDIYSVGINANLLFLALVLFSRGSLKGSYKWIFLLYFCCCVALVY